MDVSQPSKEKSSGISILEKEYFTISVATPDDVEALVTLHYICFTKKDHIAMRFGKPFMISTYKWFVTSPETFVEIAKHNDKLIGFQSVSDRPYDAPMLRAGWRQALLGLVIHPWLAFNPELLRRLSKLSLRRNNGPIESKQAAQLAFIGVDPQARGKGVGKALVLAAIQDCRKRGIHIIDTGVLRQNVRSIAMLKAAGLHEVPELETKHFIHLRIELDSNPG